jgi:DNA-binding transcriptional MerR regulator
MPQTQTPTEHPEVFMLREVAEILGLPPTRVKNWTIGRPHTIKPSIRAHGSGSRNLYDIYDLYRLAIVAQLSSDGFTADAIQLIMAELGNHFRASALALVTSSGGPAQWKKENHLQVRVVSPAQYKQDGWRVVDGPASSSFGCYVLNISKIAGIVDDLAERHVKGSVGIYRSVEEAPVKEEEMDLLRRKRKYKLEE